MIVFLWQFQFVSTWYILISERQKLTGNHRIALIARVAWLRCWSGMRAEACSSASLSRQISWTERNRCTMLKNNPFLALIHICTLFWTLFHLYLLQHRLYHRCLAMCSHQYGQFDQVDIRDWFHRIDSLAASSFISDRQRYDVDVPLS